MMAGIGAKNTKPEMIIRQGLHKLGFRYRLHGKKLPGKPDLVLPKYGAVIFVNGCFWHGHSCEMFKLPSTRAEFWRTKIAKNAINDAFAQDALKAEGWRVGIVWECALRGKRRLPNGEAIHKITSWLRSTNQTLEI